MKGFVEETVWMVTIIIALLIIALFFYTQQSSGIEVRKKVEERVINEEGISVLLSLSSNKPPVIEKYYSQILVDAVLEGSFSGKPKDSTYYGNGIGLVNLTQIIPTLIDKFTDKNWKLTMITPDGDYSYGETKISNLLYSYDILVPVPEERVGKIRFELS